MPASRGYARLAAAIATAGIVVAASILVSLVLQPTKTVTSTVTLWNVNSSAASGVPVLLMQANSTAYICVVYQSSWQGNPANFPNLGPPLFVDGIYRFGLSTSKGHCAPTAGGGTACTSTNSNSFMISALPSFIQPTATTDHVSVLYTITALGNSTGFYDSSAPFDSCGGMPMAVGYTASQINATDFAQRTIPSCPFLFFTPYSVSVSDMSVTYIHFP